MLTAAFLSTVPNRLGGILITSSSVDIENNCAVVDEPQFMNLWVIFNNFSEAFLDLMNYLKRIVVCSEILKFLKTRLGIPNLKIF